MKTDSKTPEPTFNATDYVEIAPVSEQLEANRTAALREMSRQYPVVPPVPIDQEVVVLRAQVRILSGRLAKAVAELRRHGIRVPWE